MTNRRAPAAMWYEAEKFWSEVRAAVQVEVAKIQGESALAEATVLLLQTALDRTGLPLRPAYTPAEIRQLFRISEQTFSEWTTSGLVRLTPVGRGKCVLFADLLALFTPKPSPWKGS